MKNLIKRIILDFQHRPPVTVYPREVQWPQNIDKIITIAGPRRAGKTYYLYQIMEELEAQGVPRSHMLYMNFEDERLELNGHYDDILDAWRELYPKVDLSKVYFFFDEIQEAPQWEKFVRRTFDSVTRHLFLTGSNAKLLASEIATSLRGRSLLVEVMPLSFKEFLDFKAIDSKDRYSSENLALIQHAFEDYRLWGGYPELVTADLHVKTQILQDYFNVMIFRDLVERFKVNDVSLAKYLVKRLIACFTKEYSINKLFNELKSKGLAVSKDWIYQFADQLFSIYMLSSLEKFAPSVVKRGISNKKVYLYDNGMVSISNFSSDVDQGKLLENLVFCRLKQSTDELFFLKNGWECDFVAFSHGAPPLLIQVTESLNHNNLKRELKGLESAHKAVPNAERLLLVHQIDKELSIPSGIEILPVHEWLLS